MLNILDVIFLIMIANFLFASYLPPTFERYLPTWVIKVLKSGYPVREGEFDVNLEIPKSWYRHFYVYSVMLSGTIFLNALGVYFFNLPVNKYWYSILNALFQCKSSVSVSAALLTLLLIIVQCSRRYYETCYLQIFSKSAKINMIFYVVAIVHYTGVILSAIGEAPLFCGDQERGSINWIDTRTTIVAFPSIALFTWAWIEQYKSNVILANLRRNRSGQVVTEEYKIPSGRLFNYVSSPHRLCEIIIYLAYLILIPTRTYLLIFVWVFINQVLAAIYTNVWYKSTFQHFSKNKKAIIPGIL